jgi:tripartite-type tricarboxylate transporter receptor subunit TctC
MMKLFHRRQFLHLTAGAAALSATSSVARAQAYPSRPVRLVVGWPAGGPTDIAARLVAQWLSERLGQQFIVENRPGATGNIGTEAVVRAPSDGYTLLAAVTANAINASLYETLNFNFIRDIAPVAGIAEWPLVMAVNPSFPANSVSQFIAHLKANPGKITYASAGSGSPQHVAAELFKLMAGVDMLHVPYRGAAPALADLIAGQVHITFDPLASSIEYIKSGKVRALAVASSARSPVLPDVPMVADFLPGFEASFWCGVGVPKNAPAPIIEMLNRAINSCLADPRMKVRFAELGGTVLPGTAADFGRLIADETEKWAKVVKFSGAKAD